MTHITQIQDYIKANNLNDNTIIYSTSDNSLFISKDEAIEHSENLFNGDIYAWFYEWSSFYKSPKLRFQNLWEGVNDDAKNELSWR